jgi:hypothetical protein
MPKVLEALHPPKVYKDWKAVTVSMKNLMNSMNMKSHTSSKLEEVVGVLARVIKDQ